MAKKARNNFTQEFFRNRGYVPDGRGGWMPPPIKGDYIREKKGELIVKEKVIDTPDFKVTPVTEWFISGYSVPSKKNSRINFVNKNGKQLSLPSKNHADYVKATAMQYAVFGKEFRKSVEALGLSYPIRVEFTFIKSTKHRSDFSNLVQSVEDLMVSNGWIPDDDMLHFLPYPKPLEYDKNNPGVRIKLLK